VGRPTCKAQAFRDRWIRDVGVTAADTVSMGAPPVRTIAHMFARSRNARRYNA